MSTQKSGLDSAFVEPASWNTPQVLAHCKLTFEEYKHCLNMMNKSSAVILMHDPKDCWVNGYNPYLFHAWNANHDVQLILNAYGAIQHTLTLQKKRDMSDYLKTLNQNTNDNVNERDEIRAIMQAYSKKREVSAQECVTRACGINMKKCSRGVIFIPTNDNSVKMSRSTPRKHNSRKCKCVDDILDRQI